MRKCVTAENSPSRVEQLVTQHFGLTSLLLGDSRFDSADAVSISTDGLLEAATKFNDSGNFEAYAKSLIRNRAIDFIRCRLGRSERQRRVREPFINIKSIEFETEEDCTLGDLIASGEDVVGSIIARETFEMIRIALGKLPERERFVICSHFGLFDYDESTLEEIGNSLGVSCARASQIRSKALRKMRYMNYD